MSPLPRELWQDLIGMPFQRGGRGPDTFDCYGLLLTLFQRQGLSPPTCPAPMTEAALRDAYSVLIPHWHKCPVHPGAMLLFNDSGPYHVGVAIDDDLFIHAAERVGQVALDRLSRPWGRLLISPYELA